MKGFRVYYSLNAKGRDQSASKLEAPPMSEWLEAPCQTGHRIPATCSTPVAWALLLPPSHGWFLLLPKRSTSPTSPLCVSCPCHYHHRSNHLPLLPPKTPSQCHHHVGDSTSSCWCISIRSSPPELLPSHPPLHCCWQLKCSALPEEVTCFGE